MTDIKRSNGPERDRASTLRVNPLSKPCPQGAFSIAPKPRKSALGTRLPLSLTRVDCLTRVLVSVKFVLLEANCGLRVVFGIERGQRSN